VIAGVGRGLALFFSGFGLLNFLGALLFHANFNLNIWWIDFRPLPPALGNLILFVASALLAWYAVRPCMSRWRKRGTVVATGALLLMTVFDAASFFGLVALGEIGSGFPLPLSLLVAAALVMVLVAIGREGGDPIRRRLAWWLAALTVPVVAVLFPLAQMYCFGKTDYRRPADAAVVFGAAVRSNGKPSHALADRVRTGCKLYGEGLVKKLIFSGGPGPGKVDEVAAMKALAMKHGVREEDIVLDPAGINTQATVNNTTSMFSATDIKKVLAVSHFYHLPRIKMTYGRAGVNVYTVPADQQFVLLKLPWFLAREVAALWVYYLRPMVE